MVEGKLGRVSRWGWSFKGRPIGVRLRSWGKDERIRLPLAAELGGLLVVAGEPDFGGNFRGSGESRAGRSYAKGLRNDETKE